MREVGEQKSYTVYLSAFNDETVRHYFGHLKGFQFQVFSKEVKQAFTDGNITFLPVNNRLFTESMINSAAIVTGAGFETPAEALHLHKKIMAIPIRGQYEQLCNAAALQKMGVKVIHKIDNKFAQVFREWIATDAAKN